MNSFGVITNSINTAVFMHPEMKDPSFKYLLAASISNLIYNGLHLSFFICSCVNCLDKRSFYKLLYGLIALDFGGRAIALFSILIEIFLSIQRYMVLKNKLYLKDTTHKWLIFVLFLASLIYWTPLLLFEQIVPANFSNQTNNMTFQGYKLSKNERGLSIFGKVTLTVLQILRFFAGSIVVSIINSINVWEFRKRYSKKNLIQMSK